MLVSMKVVKPSEVPLMPSGSINPQPPKAATRISDTTKTRFGTKVLDALSGLVTISFLDQARLPHVACFRKKRSRNSRKLLEYLRYRPVDCLSGIATRFFGDFVARRAFPDHHAPRGIDEVDGQRAHGILRDFGACRITRPGGVEPVAVIPVGRPHERIGNLTDSNLLIEMCMGVDEHVRLGLLLRIREPRHLQLAPNRKFQLPGNQRGVSGFVAPQRLNEGEAFIV